jgi:outer membrane protein assembly factor BamB
MLLFQRFFPRTRMSLMLGAMALLAACTTFKNPRHTLPSSPKTYPGLEVAPVWHATIASAGAFIFQPIVVADALYTAAANGDVGKIDAASGRLIWQTKLATPLSAGVGSDGKKVAVGGINGWVYVLNAQGALEWKAQVRGEMISPPLVGYGLVLVRTVDGYLTAFDAQTGVKKWRFQSQPVALNLRTTMSMVFADSHTVMAGFSDGSIVAIDLSSGQPYWQASLFYPSGITEAKRMADVVGSPVLMDQAICAASFQGLLGCFDRRTGEAIWARPFSSIRGAVGKRQALFVVGENSTLAAYDAREGGQYWQTTALQGKRLGFPAIVGAAVVVGDHEGLVHFLSQKDGSLVNSFPTHGGAIVARPLLAGHSASSVLIVQTRNGHIYAFRPK